MRDTATATLDPPEQSAPARSPRTPLVVQARREPSVGGGLGIRPRLLIDIVLTVSFLALMSVSLTGLMLHEWWGIGLIVVIVGHLLAQWDWTVASTRRFFGGLTGRVRVTYVVNWLLFIATVLVMVSGIMISEAVLPALGIPTARSSGSTLFRFWRVAHSLSANAIIVLAGVHLGLNWRWVVNAIRQIARLPQRRSVDAAAEGTRS